MLGGHPSRCAQSAHWFPPVFLGLESVASRTTEPGREFGQCHGKKVIAEMNLHGKKFLLRFVDFVCKFEFAFFTP